MSVEVVDFWAPWCGPCKMIMPTINRLIEEGLPIVKVNVDEDAEAATKSNIRSIPTIVVFKDGVEIDRRTGSGAPSAIEEFIRKHV